MSLDTSVSSKHALNPLHETRASLQPDRVRYLAINAVQCAIAGAILCCLNRTTSEGMRIEHDPDRDIMGVELIDSMSILQSSELDDGVVLNYSKDRKTISVEVMGVKEALATGTGDN